MGGAPAPASKAAPVDPDQPFKSGTVADLDSLHQSRAVKAPPRVPKIDSDATRCSICGCSCTTKKLLRCSGCKISWYCGADCQKNAWPRHRAACLRAQGKPDHRPVRDASEVKKVSAAGKKKSKIDDLKICFKCGGLGQYTDKQDIMSGMYGDKFSGLQRVITGECDACEGDGYIDQSKCPKKTGGEAADGTAQAKPLSEAESAQVYSDYKKAMDPEKRKAFDEQIRKARDGITD
eukprot:SAG22_NODE_971_length_6228_cov_2.774515_3_plen_235_part_00